MGNEFSSDCYAEIIDGDRLLIVMDLGFGWHALKGLTVGYRWKR